MRVKWRRSILGSNNGGKAKHGEVVGVGIYNKSKKQRGGQRTVRKCLLPIENKIEPISTFRLVFQILPLKWSKT